MSKNLIYIVAISDNSTKVDNHDYAEYSIKNWKEYCKRNDIDFLLIDKNLDDRFNKPIWNKEMIYEFGKEYDKIGIVDSDTLVDLDSPNIFELFDEDDFCGVSDLCDLNWLFTSISDRQKFFPNVEMDIFKYINAGVLFFGNKYLHIFQKLLNLYLTRKEEIEKIDGGGKEQTLLNFILQEEKVPMKLLDPCWNLLSIHKKNMFVQNWQIHPEFKGSIFRDNPDSYPHFMKYAYIWHFTGFPVEDRAYYMSIVWDLIKS